MLLRDLTKPLNEVEVSVENKWLPGIVFSPRPVAHPSHLVQIAIMQVTTSADLRSRTFSEGT